MGFSEIIFFRKLFPTTTLWRPCSHGTTPPATLWQTPPTTLPQPSHIPRAHHPHCSPTSDATLERPPRPPQPPTQPSRDPPCPPQPRTQPSSDPHALPNLRCNPRGTPAPSTQPSSDPRPFSACATRLCDATSDWSEVTYAQFYACSVWHGFRDGAGDAAYGLCPQEV